MSFFRRLFGQRPNTTAVAPFVSGDGYCDVETVGESNYQPALWRAVRGADIGPRGYRMETSATLRSEPSNPYDKNAVQVLIDDQLVGYLSRENAITFQPLMHRYGGLLRCPALVCGGFQTEEGRAHLGVWLDPPEPERPSHADDVRLTGRSATSRSGEAPEHGLYMGKHYSEYVEEVQTLKRHKAHEEALALLGHLMDAVEQEASANQWDAAPWYYEQAAIVYRKLRDFDGEVAVLERYAAHVLTPERARPELMERLQKARAKNLVGASD